MVNMSQGLQGKNVYGSGSFAPTKGRVSAKGAQGYLKREINNNRGNVGVHGGAQRVGGDGESDTRSGVAAAALGRQKNASTGVGGGPQNMPTRRVVPGNQARAKKKRTNGNGRPAPPVNTPPAVTVSDTGQITLPYSDAWSEEMYSNLATQNAALLKLQQEQQQSNMLYENDLYETEKAYKEASRDNLNTAGSSGVAFSSAYGTAVGNTNNAHTTLKNQLARANAMDNQMFDTERTGIITNFKDTAARQALAYVQSLAEDAGNLGYGDSKPKNFSIGGKDKKKGKNNGPRRKRNR